MVGGPYPLGNLHYQHHLCWRVGSHLLVGGHCPLGNLHHLLCWVGNHLLVGGHSLGHHTRLGGGLSLQPNNNNT